MQLWGKIGQKWDAEPFIVRITANPLYPLPLRSREAFLANKPISCPPPDFRAYLFFEDSSIPAGTRNAQPIVFLPEPLRYLGEGDILRIVPSRGEISVLYRKQSHSNAILLTERCNNDCIMCSQPPRKNDDQFLVEAWLEAIPLMDVDTRELGVTGGEPTLLRNDLIRLVRACKHYLPATSVHILSNGRMFSYLTYCQALAGVKHPDLTVGIPLHSDLAHQHDFFVQCAGAFDQTVLGIMSLGVCPRIPR